MLPPTLERLYELGHLTAARSRIERGCAARSRRCRARDSQVGGRRVCDLSGAAGVLGRSAGTVRNYLSDAIARLAASNRVDAARIARAKAWL
jgi:hypothetical protein